MINPKFHLQPQPDKSGSYPILMLFSVNKKRLQYYSGLKVPASSKPEKGEKKNKYSFKEFPGSAAIKVKLDALRSHAYSIESDLIKQGLEQSIEAFKIGLDERFKGRISTPDNGTLSIEDIITEYLLKLKRESAYNTFRTAQTNLNHFRNYLGKSGAKLSVGEIDEKLIEYYNEWLKDGRLNNTVVKAMQVLRTFLQYCLKKRHISAMPLLDTGSPNDITVIHLTYSEVMRIAYTPMPTVTLERVRDFFLFGCFTGMRYGDIANLNKSSVFKDHIKFFTEKNGSTQTLTVPLVPGSKCIVEKYKDTVGLKAIPSLSNQKTNDHLKLVAKYAGIDEKIEIAERDAFGKVTKRVYQKHELVSCHISRKSFITIAMTLGMPESTIVSITGHSKGSKAFHKYYDVVNETKFEQMNKIFS